MTSLIEAVVQFSGVSQSEVQSLAALAPNRYKMYDIPKKKGGTRRIFHPSKETKLLQYSILEVLLGQLPVHPAACGFIRGLKSPLLESATRHSQNTFILKADFTDFFPSIRPVDLFKTIPIGDTFNNITITKQDHNFLENCLFIRAQGKHLGLPIGAPSSPCTSNIIMHRLDYELTHLASKYDSIYSRYADDLTFSTNTKGISQELLEHLRDHLSGTSSPRLSLNESKTQFMSKNCRRAVSGLVITPDGAISVGRNNKRKIRALLHQAKEKNISEEDASYLQGYLAFLNDVEPSYLNNLTIKYGSKVMKFASKRLP